MLVSRFSLPFVVMICLVFCNGGVLLNIDLYKGLYVFAYQ